MHRDGACDDGSFRLLKTQTGPSSRQPLCDQHALAFARVTCLLPVVNPALPLREHLAGIALTHPALCNKENMPTKEVHAESSC